MTVRIPKPLNTALDWASRHSITAIAGGGFVFSLLILPWFSTVAAATATATTLAAVLITGVQSVTSRLRGQIKDLEWENGSLRAELERISAGDASATTAKIFTIGEEEGDR